MQVNYLVCIKYYEFSTKQLFMVYVQVLSYVEKNNCCTLKEFLSCVSVLKLTLKALT